MLNSILTHVGTVTFPTAPKTTVTAKGDIVAEEVNRPGVSRLEKYVAEMAAGSTMTHTINVRLSVFDERSI